ncbi:phage holin family protein [Aeromicrobium sp.]|uniref:phage holin family protein n=1 Tax=Aeromicrobium sp. TaxID=1871063 RepID=UPI003D6B48EC
MTAQTEVPVSIARTGEPLVDASERMLGSAKRLFLHGLVLLLVAVALGIAETLALWMGALIIAALFLVVAAFATLAGLIGRLGSRPPRRWS